MKEFKDKVAVITGAGSGFGREFARIGASLGMKLVLADIQADALEETRAEMEAQGAEVIAQVVDVSNGAQIEALAEAFNLTNRRNVLGRNATFGTGAYPDNPVPTFDQTTAVGDPRSVQLGVRVRF